MHRHRGNLSGLVIRLGLLIASIVVLFPVFWMVVTAFKIPKELFSTTPALLPAAPTLDNFATVLFRYSFFHWLWNSFTTTFGIVVGQLSIALLAAFALCHFKTSYNNVAFLTLISTMVIPFQVTLIPCYLLITKLGLMNSIWAVILTDLSSATSLFFLRQHFRALPQAFGEAAAMEGAGSLWILVHVTAPLCKSSIAAMAILCAIDGWNQFLWPMLVLTKPETRTLTIGLQQFLDHEAGNLWGPFMATATLASLPVLVLYFFIQKSIIEAFVDSGIKA